MNEKVIKMVAIDLDGTLLQSDHTLSARSIEVLREIASKGIVICIATGRSTLSVAGYLKQLGLDNSFPCVTFNGASGVHLESREGAGAEPIFLDSLSSEDANELLQLSRELGLVAQYYNAVTSEITAVPANEVWRTPPNPAFHPNPSL